MLTVFSGATGRDCSGSNRRDFLRIGTLGLAGLTLPELLASRAGAAEAGGYVNDRSVVFLFLNGGPSQFETFDPKMEAPAEIRTMTGAVQTRLPGVHFGSHFPKMAALADRLAVVRSFVPANGSHDSGAKLLSGGSLMKASMGAIYARLAGAGHPRTGLPNNVLVTPMSAGRDPESLSLNNGGNQSFRGALETGPLPTAYTAFHPTSASTSKPTTGKNGGGKKTPAGVSNGNDEGLLADMRMRIPADRLEDRRGLLKQLDQLQRGLDSGQQLDEVDRYRQQAYDVILSGISKAFDLSQEDPRTLARYDTSTIKTPDNLARQLPQTRAHSPVVLGKQMLLARRLCEAGCGFITVGTTGWDMHGNNGFGILDGMDVMGTAVDHAVAAFLTDLEERGLSDKVLLVIAGEMGRTPKIVTRAAQQAKSITRAGRDHWANLGPLVLAGGGLKMGQTVGASDRNGNSPTTRPVTLSHLMATVMHTLFDVGQVRIQPGLPVDLVRGITEGLPIPELVS